MHLLGTSIKIEANPGTPRARTLLDIPVWNFDDQGSKPVAPYHLKPSDTVRVTCHHAQSLRDQQPSFEKQRAGPLRRMGRGQHRRDVPRHPAGHHTS